MIDINELRLLAQAATPGPDGTSLNWIKLLQDFQEEANPSVICELIDRLEAAEKERDDVAMQLAQSEQGKRKISEERDALQAKIEAMEKQQPVAYLPLSSARVLESGVIASGVVWNCRDKASSDIPLYTLSGAQPAPSIPEGWIRAIDEALVVAHIGVANESDTYEQAKAKLNNLIGFHVDVATDPAVNGGWKLMPIEPTKEIYECFAAYDGTSYSNPFDFDDFSVDYAAASAAAPGAKP